MQDRPAVVFRDKECQNRTDADADVAVAESPPCAEQQHSRKTANASGQYGDDDLYRLEQYKDDRSGDSESCDKTLQRILGRKDPLFPAIYAQCDGYEKAKG